MAVSALAGWFGGNRMLASHVGDAMRGCSWVGVVFAGGMSELPHIDARTIVVNDLHRHIINCARCVADDVLRPQMIRRLRRKAFHPEELADAQQRCLLREEGALHGVGSMVTGTLSLEWAIDYFVCCWMNRGGKAGIDSEFNGRPSVRWKADGGDSMVRYQSAIRMLAEFSRTLRRCTFETMDAFDFLARCEDNDDSGIYADPPFPEVGRRYKHNAGQTAAEERAWHTRLRDALQRFERTRVVARFYDHPMVRELYHEATGWHWQQLEGRTQANREAPEVLLVRNPAKEGLFA